MINPVMAMAITIFLFLMISLLFLLQQGYLVKKRKTGHTDTKILMEDSLKYLFDCEQKNERCDNTAMAKALGVRPEQSDQVMIRLRTLGLVNAGRDAYFLSDEGRAYALRVIRIHRLWERYLAENTGIPEADWHTRAEIQEHRLSIEEANELSRQMGYPRYDPHGDPIPTRSGDMPPERGKSLIEFKEGDIARVLHIEDEPPELYAQIIAKGINLDSRLEILKKLKNGLHVLTKGTAQSLSISMARNITGIHSEYQPEVEEIFVTLSSLKHGEKAEVSHIDRSCRGTQRRRLMDLGVVPGTVITMEMTSAGGDPRAYNIRGALIALRKEQADLINIKPISGAI